jgi:succinate dehydrogenase / fumarate reductase membrane anchor subunit
MSLKSDLARVRGLGSAKTGTHHFWHQRLTAIALIPLGLWLVTSLVCIMRSDFGSAQAWVTKPHVTILLVATLAAMFYHLKLGMQTVIEDYLHNESLKLASIIGLNLGTALCALASIVAVLRISFGTN